MKTSYLLKQPNCLIRTAIEAEILFAVCLSKIGFWSDSVKTPPEKSPCSKKIGAVLVQQADRRSFEASAVFNFVFFVMLKNKIEQSAAQRCLRPFELQVLPFGKTSGIKLLNLLNSPSDRIFGNRPMKKVHPCTFFISEFCICKTLKAKTTAIRGGERGYVEDVLLPCDAGDACIFSKEETGLYYYGARYLDPKYSRWLSGDPSVNDYIPKALEDFGKKWDEKYPMIKAAWQRNWNELSEFFNYPEGIRKAVYTTNAIESLNFSLRKITRNKSSFPDDDSIYKVMYLAIRNASKRWTMPIKN